MHTFFFGAGADRAYGLCEGVDFAAPLMFDKFLNERKLLLGEKASNSNLVFPQSRTVFLQTVENYKEEAKRVFDDETINMMLICYNKSDSQEYKNASKILFNNDSNGNSGPNWYAKTKKYYDKVQNGEVKKDTPYKLYHNTFLFWHTN